MSENKQEQKRDERQSVEESQGRKVNAGSEAEVRRVTKQQEELDAALVQEDRERREAAAAQDEEARNHEYPASHLHEHAGKPENDAEQH